MGLTAEKFGAFFGLLGKHRARTVFSWENGKLTPTKERTEKMEEQSKLIPDQGNYD